MIITRSPLRITLGGGGTDLPSYYRRARRLPDRRGDRQVRLRHRDAAVRARHLPQVLAARARRADRRGAASDHPRGAQAARLQDAADRDHDAGRHSGRHRARLVRQLHHRAAEGAARASPRDSLHPQRARRAGLPHRDRPARASRSASRTSTSPRTAASPASRFSQDGTVEARAAQAVRSRRCYELEDNLLLFFTGFSRSAVDDPEGSGHAQRDVATPSMIDNLHYVKELGLQSQAGARGRRSRRRSAS